VVRELEEECAKGAGGDLSGFDEKLTAAAQKDAAAYAGEVVSAVERQRAGAGVHSWREGDLLTCAGWTRAEYPYFRDKTRRGKRWAAFGVERKRVLCGADGEKALESILTADFPQAVFFNDFMHAASYLSTACHAPGIAGPDGSAGPAGPS